MIGRVQKKVAAKRDLIEHFVYIGADSDDAALRFLAATEDLRRWHVEGFENYLILYRPIKGGIDVARVLHGARDIERLFK
jgi:plasmid stabilization system protein ParE